MEFLNSCRAGQACFKDHLTVNSDMYCFNLTVAFSNKKKKKKNMENWRSLLRTTIMVHDALSIIDFKHFLYFSM